MCRTRGRVGTKLSLLCVLVVATFASFAGAAFAESGETTPTPAGELMISAQLTAGSFGGTLTGLGFTLQRRRRPTAALRSAASPSPMHATSGVGWYVTVSATRFENQTFPGKDIALDSLTMPRLSVESADASCTAPPGRLHQAATVDTGGDGVIMVTCTEHGQGQGTYIFTAADSEPWELAITADEYAGTYTSTVTTTVATLSL